MTVSLLYELRNIKRFARDRSPILDIEKLTIEAGSVTAIVGENGAGKSTLLKIMAFLASPDEGEIFFDGKPVLSRDLFKLRRNVTMVDQTPLLFHGSVFNNVAYGLKVRNVPESQWAKPVAEALSLLDISGYENRSVKNLSGGEAQRAAIARAIVFKPPVLLLDEPTAGIDAARVEIVESLIRDMNRRSGVGVVFSTHQLSQAYRLTENVFHIVAGKICDEGIDNVFVGQVGTENGRRILHSKEGLKIVVAAGCEGARRFSVPASSITIVRKSDKQKFENGIEGTVTRMEVRGENIRIRIDGEKSLRVETAKKQIKEQGIMPGDSVVAIIPPESVRSLD